MEINVKCGLTEEFEFKKDLRFLIDSSAVKKVKLSLDAFAYPPLVNSHDHLVGNWYPKAGPNAPYINSHIWVNDMKLAESVKERSNFWRNNGDFNLANDEGAKTLALLGAYKNIFSGVGIVQDHIPRQEQAYYSFFPIRVIKEYRQCHSITMGNWWGGKTPQEEMKLTKGRIPFIIHVGEGTDPRTKKEFSELLDLGLVKDNILMVHCISLTRDELKKCADLNASICWLPNSNHFLIGKTLDIYTCLELGVNVCLGTDSALTGSKNLLSEIEYAHRMFPKIPAKTLFEMVTVNALKALKLSKNTLKMNSKTDKILLTDVLDDNPYENIPKLKMNNIQLLMTEGRPIYGDESLLRSFEVDTNEYHLFKSEGRKKFVYGHPEKLLKQIEDKLGYKKEFPYIP